MELGVCTLEDIIRNRRKQSKKWSEIELIKIAHMLIDGLFNVLQSLGISHRDISANNIILDHELKNYKVIDFGEAIGFAENTRDVPLVGKLKYMAPELHELIEKCRQGKITHSS
jgi:serine/threonine protein kinase